MTAEPHSACQFGPFRFDRRTLILFRDGVPVRLSPKAGRLLLMLIDARGEILSKDDLMAALWPGTFVEEANITFQVHELRKALGDRKGATTYIETIPRRGYRLLVPVVELQPHPPAPADVGDASAPAASPVADVAAVATEARAIRRVPRAVWLSAVTVGGLVIALLGLYAALKQPAPAPRAARYVRLTHDGRLQSKLLPYDRSHLVVYVGEKSLLLDLATGRLANPPVPEGYLLLDVSQTRREGLAYRPRDRGAECALWVVPLDGRNPRRLGFVCSTEAAWSPDGSRIAYAAQTGLFTIAPDGSLLRQLATFSGEPAQPHWSPDGRTIRFNVVVSSNRVATSTIWEIQSNGAGLHQVAETSSSGSWNCCGSWMPPEGRDFAFQSNRDGRQHLWLLHDESPLFGAPFARLMPLTSGRLEFFAPVASPDGSRVYALGRPAGGRTFRYDPAQRTLDPYLGGLPVWWIDYSPDGKRIAYVSEPDRRLWIANADGSAARELPIAPIGDVDACAWSPDGKLIAFRGAERQRQHKIYLIAADGGPPTPLTAADVEQGIASWSPDSMHLTFGDVPERFGQPTGSEAIHVYDLATGTDHAVPGSNGLWTSRWSPDGHYLAALTIRGQALMLFDWTRGAWRPMNVDHVDNPTWSRDGRYLYFGAEGNVDRPLSRLRIADGAIEGLVAIDASTQHWSGVTSDNFPIVLTADTDVYALELQR